MNHSPSLRAFASKNVLRKFTAGVKKLIDQVPKLTHPVWNLIDLLPRAVVLLQKLIDQLPDEVDLVRKLADLLPDNTRVVPKLADLLLNLIDLLPDDTRGLQRLIDPVKSLVDLPPNFIDRVRKEQSRALDLSNRQPQTRIVCWHPGYFEQPQNSDPAFDPLAAVRRQGSLG